MSFPRYERYKDSGVEWLGDVPEHWGVRALRHNLSAVFNGISCDQVEPSESTVAVTRIETISTGVIDLDKVGFIDNRWARADRKLLFGDVLFSNINSLSMIGNCALVTFQGDLYAGMNLLVLRPNATFVLPEFLFWMLKSPQFRDEIESHAKPAINQASISQTSLKSIDTPQLSLMEQRKIASFLNRETAKIDTLIEEQRRLIALLKEKRQAIISHAVTKGLDPGVPMKESGTQWLGPLPAHWRVKPLKHVSPEIGVGIVIEPSKYYVEVGVPALRSLNIRPGKIVMENLVFISDEANNILSKSRLMRGDLVAVRSGQPGATAVIPDDLNGCNCIDLIVIRRPEDANGRFLCLYLNSDAAVRQFSEGSGGAMQQHFNIGSAKDLQLTIPPITEQADIVSFIDKESRQLDLLIAEATTAIALLQERRAALISAAVTGKIDVRNYAPPEKSVPEELYELA